MLILSVVGLSVAIACLVSGLFEVGGRNPRWPREIAAFLATIGLAAVFGLCMYDPIVASKAVYAFGCAFCCGLAILEIAFLRYLFHTMNGQKYPALFLFRYMAYCALLAAFASLEPLRPILMQLTAIASLFAIACLALYGISYCQALNPKSLTALIVVLPSFFVGIVLGAIILGFGGINGLLAANAWAVQIILAGLPLTLVFFCLGGLAIRRYLVHDREDWFVSKHRRRRPEDLNHV